MGAVGRRAGRAAPAGGRAAPRCAGGPGLVPRSRRWPGLLAGAALLLGLAGGLGGGRGVATAVAQERPSVADRSHAWDGLHDALLVEAVDGTPGVAAQLLQETLEDLAPGDPFRAEVLFWLGRSQLEVGREADALATFREAAGLSQRGDAAREAIAALELLSKQVRHLPFTCTFDEDPCGVVRSWVGSDKGGVQLRDAGDAVVLAWDTNVEASETDHLRLALAPGLKLRRVTLHARATRFPADLRFTIVDASGARFSAPMVRVDSGSWTAWSVSLADFGPVEPGTLGDSPREARVLVIEDLTALLSTDRGTNTILLDDLVLE